MVRAWMRGHAIERKICLCTNWWLTAVQRTAARE